MDCKEEIRRLIPHRPPFLWVDRIVSLKDDAIETEKTVPVDLEIFKGHYPDHPIMPGVLLCEAVFQSGAIMISRSLAQEGSTMNGVPVLTRINGAKFKREVKPGALLKIEVKTDEVLAGAWFMKGKISVAGQTVLTVKFACSMSKNTKI